MTNREYWEKRAEERKNTVTRMAEEAAEKARETYERAKHQINKEVAYWIQQFADAEGISYEEARKMLTDGEWEQYRMTLEEYIRRGEQLGVHPEWEAAMIKASALHHIDRLAVLKMIIRAELEETKVKLQDTEWMHNIADYSFQQTLFTIETDQEVAIQFRLPDLETMHQTIEQAWAPDGMNFVEREGVNNDKLTAEVERLLTQACVTGESYEELAKQLTDQFNLKEYEAERIIRTEATQIATRSEMAAYQAAGIDEYEFLATLDEKTCKICGPMDGQVFPVADAEPGITAPPLHPNCRCTTIGHYEDDIDDTRIARDEDGKNIWVDGDTTWEEWQKQYGNRVTDSAKDDTIKTRNIAERNMSGGSRRSQFHVLSAEEIESITKDAESIGIPVDILRFNQGSQTGLDDETGLINVRGDILPDMSSSNNRDRLSQRAALAHEYYGHYAFHPSSLRVGDWRDEFRASYRAAVDTPHLSDEERRMLMIDAYDRLKEAGVSTGYSKEARRIIYGHE